MKQDLPAPSRPRRRVAIGPARPRYLLSAENDRLFMMLSALAAEVSALRDRVDTMEALAEQGLLATSQAIEAFVLPAERQVSREAGRMAMLRRVFRVMTEELDAVRETADGTIADLAEAVRDTDERAG